MGAKMYRYIIYEVKDGVRKRWASCDVLTNAMQICNAISEKRQCHMIVVNDNDTLVMYDIGSKYDPDRRMIIL